jgi:hypothetical protein
LAANQLMIALRDRMVPLAMDCRGRGRRRRSSLLVGTDTAWALRMLFGLFSRPSVRPSVCVKQVRNDIVSLSCHPRPFVRIHCGFGFSSTNADQVLSPPPSGLRSTARRGEARPRGEARRGLEARRGPTDWSLRSCRRIRLWNHFLASR